jgi:monothiol glutaredoxin
VVSGIDRRMKTRPLLDPTRIAPAAAEKLATLHADVVAEVANAVETHPIVVVGMAQNPHVKNVRKALEAAGLPFTYLEYGSYFSAWKQRLAIKQWSGWPTFPQVFARGVLIGGEELTRAAIADGTLQARAAAPAASAITADA